MIGQELKVLVQRLLEKSSRLETDAARTAFATEAEAVIAGNDFSAAPVVAAGLHWVTADALASVTEGGDEQPLYRILRHLDAAAELASTADAVPLAGQVRWLRAAAFMRAPHLPPQLVQQAVAAFEEALADPEASASDEYRGPLAFNAAIFRLRQGGIPEDPEARSHVRSLFELAHESYRRGGRMAEAADAALYLAHIGLSELQSGGLVPEERARVFESAWHRIGEAMAARDPVTDLQGWGRSNDLAGTLLLHRPGMDEGSNAQEAMKYFDRALQAYQKLRDREAIRECALHLLDAMDARPIPWDETMAKRYEVYVDALREADNPGDAAQPRLRLRLANAWMKVSKPGSSGRRAEILQRVGSLAREAASASAAAGEHDVSATAYKLLGATLLGDDPSSLEGEPGPCDCDRLAQASDALNLAVEHGRAANDAAVLAAPLRMLTVALGRRIQQCGDFDLLERCMSALEETIPLSEGEELAATGANYVGLTLLAHRQGRPWPLDRARAVLHKAIGALAQVDKVTLAHYVKSLEGGLDELEFLGVDGMTEVDALRMPGGELDPAFVRPEDLGFKIYRKEVKAVPGATASADVVTLLLLPQVDGRADGRLHLAKTGDGVEGSLSLPCPRCAADLALTLPVAVSADPSSSILTRIESMARGSETCAACGATHQVQSIFTLARASPSERPAVVFPDLFTEGGEGLLRHQNALVRALHEAWTGDPLPSALGIPWSVLPAFRAGIDEHALLAVRRQHGVLLMVNGLLSGSARHFQEGLRALASDDESGEVASGEVETVLDALVNEGRMSEAGPRAVREITNTVNALIARSRAAGPGVVADELARGFTELRAARPVVEEALRIAGDRSARRAFLARFVAQSPDYSPDRANALYENLALGAELELEQLEELGIPASDPDRYLDAQAGVRAAQAIANDWIERDRTSNSSGPAKELITRAIEGREPFVLILRAFALDISISEPSDEARRLVAGTGDARIGVRVISMASGKAHVVDALCDALPEGARALIVANVLDLAPPTRPAKIFVSDIEWQRLAFSLIPEAAVIILIYPKTHTGHAAGVAQEIDAIRRLECEHRTVVVLANPKDAGELGEIYAAPVPVDETDQQTSAADMAELGFTCVFTESEIGEQPARFADKVRSVVRGG